MTPQEQEIVQELTSSKGCDVYLHSGFMGPPADDQMLECASRRPRRDNAYLFVATYGGLARSAYRVMRCLRHAYEHVTVVVDGPCKSAGTLLVIGADTIVMGGAAELGPLDVQILKSNELVERQSGLATGFTFQALTSEAIDTFRKAFVELKLGGRLTTTTATAAAANLAVGIFAPIYAQIDPLRIGEVAMANLVAHRYAERLTKHEGEPRAIISADSILRLLSGYPSHDFAIDRTEAKDLFDSVHHPNQEERAVIAVFRTILSAPALESVTLRLSAPQSLPRHAPRRPHDEGNQTNDPEVGPHSEPSSNGERPRDPAEVAGLSDEGEKA
jgi:hypothetical protein